MAKTTATDGTPEVRKKRAYRKKNKNEEAAPVKSVEATPTETEDNSQDVAIQEQNAPQTQAPVSQVTEETTDRQALDESVHAKYERIKRGNLHITDLQNLDVVELHSIANKEGITEYMGLTKQELIFRILKERIRQDGLMYGEGVLEILPDGFGFLRSPKYNYLASPDDVYVSPSQIRRFGLRSGNIVSGQIRPPKESEKYFALLRVEAINYQEPDKLAEKVVFRDLTPLHAEERLILETTQDEVEHADHRPGHADRQRPARSDRCSAPHRQDGPAAENGQRHQHQPSGSQDDRAADRRASGRSDRHGAQGRQGCRGHQLDVRRTDRPSLPGGRNGHRKGQAHGRIRRGRRDSAGLDHASGPCVQHRDAALRQDPDRRCRRQRDADAQAVLRRRP